MRRILGVSLVLMAAFPPGGAVAAQPNSANLRELRGVMHRVIHTMGEARKHFVFPREIRDIAWVQLRAGDIEGSLHTVLAIPDRDSTWRDQALVEIASTQAEQGSVRGAFRTIRRIVDPAEKAVALSLIARAQARAGDQRGAARTFDRARSASASLAQPERELVLVNLVVSKAEGGDIAGALAAGATISDGRTRYDALAAIAAAQARAGDVTGALQTAGSIPDHLLRGGALEGVAEALVKSGERAGLASMSDEAIRSASADPTLLWYMGGPFQIALAQGRAGDRTAATGTLRDLLRIATALPDDALKVQALQNVASALAEIGDRADAGDVLRTAVQVADAIRKDSDTAFALAEIALAQIEMGERKDASASLSKALQSVLAAGDDAERADKALSRISQAQAEIADVSGATQAAARIRDPLLKAEAFLRVAAVLLREGTGARIQPILRQAAAAAPQVQDRDQRDHILNRVGCLLARAGDMPAALQAIGEKGGSVGVDALVDIGVVQAELGDRVAAQITLQRAMRIAARIPDLEEERSGAIEATAQGMAQIGDLKSALSWASGQRSPRLRLWALVGVAKGIALRIIEVLEPEMVDRPLTLRLGYGCPLSEG